MFQPFGGRLQSLRGSFFLAMLAITSTGIALLVVRHQLAGYLGIRLPESQTMSDLIFSMGDSFTLLWVETVEIKHLSIIHCFLNADALFL